MSSIVDRLSEATHDLPEPLLLEILDFAEFLRMRRAAKQERLEDVSLLSLQGGLENSQTFMGHPLDIQRRLRDEWS